MKRVTSVDVDRGMLPCRPARPILSPRPFRFPDLVRYDRYADQGPGIHHYAGALSFYAKNAARPIYTPRLKLSRIVSIYTVEATVDDTDATITQQFIIAGRTMAGPKTIRLFAEISVFNEILNDDSKIWKLRQCVDPYSVSLKRHRIIRRAIGQLYCRQHPIDVENLSWYLADHGRLDEAGGYGYLRYIARFHHSAALDSFQAAHAVGGADTAS